FTNHALVLSHIAQQPRITARDLSNTIGITERATIKIINDLLKEDYITKTREGRNNRYRINSSQAISLPGLDDMAAEVLLITLGWKKRGRPRKKAL
ncbi:winged helix-turn-helix transcriptional regulator, partial [Chloroflexota bacterium]